MPIGACPKIGACPVEKIVPTFDETQWGSSHWGSPHGACPTWGSPRWDKDWWNGAQGCRTLWPTVSLKYLYVKQSLPAPYHVCRVEYDSKQTVIRFCQNFTNLVAHKPPSDQLQMNHLLLVLCIQLHGELNRCTDHGQISFSENVCAYVSSNEPSWTSWPFTFTSILFSFLDLITHIHLLESIIPDCWRLHSQCEIWMHNILSRLTSQNIFQPHFLIVISVHHQPGPLTSAVLYTITYFNNSWLKCFTVHVHCHR